jgi:predicted permease
MRSLAKNPAFTIAVITLLALGIGANTAIFSLIKAVLLQKLPVRQPDRLVLFNLKPPSRSAYYMIPQATYRQIRDANSVFDGFAAVTFPGITLGDNQPEGVNGLMVSGNFFDTLGLNAILGRLIQPDDDRADVCVIGYRLWQRRYGSDPAVINRTIHVNGQPFTVIGVTPKQFFGLSEYSEMEISVPLAAPGMGGYRVNPVQTFGRLKPGVAIGQAQASLDALNRRISKSDVSVLLRPGKQGLSTLRSQYERPLLMWMAMAGLVLLIACANVANLLMAKASGRARDIAIRLALGAGRARLIRQLLAESTRLVFIGAGAGMVLAWWADHALLALAPRPASGGPLMLDVNPDWRVLLFTLAVAIPVSLLCGIAPAIRLTSQAPGPVIKGTAGMPAPGRISFTNALVVAQVALSLVLAISAGLFVRSLENLRSVDAGLNPNGLVVLTINSGSAGYSIVESRRFFEEIVERARHTPGVLAASPGFISPLSGGFAITSVHVPGYQLSHDEPDSFNENWIGADYFQVLGTPLLEGRTLSDQDGATSDVAMINEKAAKHFWPHQSAIGKHAIIGEKDDKTDPAKDYEIVGVVKDVKNESLRDDARPAVYLPFRQNHRPYMTLHVRVAGETAPVMSALIREIHAIDPNLPAFNVTTTAAQLDRSLVLDRLMAMLTSLFGALAALVAVVGLYGAMAYAVAARTREIGIRMALGAGRSRMLGRVLAESAALTVIGLALGVPVALWAARFAAAFLYGLSPSDPLTYVALALALTGVALSAAWIPARRAATVDPMVALKYE